MLVQQKHVTIVNLHDGRPREFVLIREQNGYRLTAASVDEVVNVLLCERDLEKLRMELAKGTEHPLFDSCITGTEPRGYSLNATDWLSFN
jgi:hypothetical protein